MKKISYSHPESIYREFSFFLVQYMEEHEKSISRKTVTYLICDREAGII